MAHLVRTAVQGRLCVQAILEIIRVMLAPISREYIREACPELLVLPALDSATCARSQFTALAKIVAQSYHRRVEGTLNF